MSYEKFDAGAAASQWEKLAKEQDKAAEWEKKHGRYPGVHLERAKVYRRTAQALRLEAETGKPHCSACLKDHPNHLHPHRG